MTGSGEARGGRTRGPLPPAAATARAASPGTRRSPAARAQSRAPAWHGGAGRTPGAPRTGSQGRRPVQAGPGQARAADSHGGGGGRADDSAAAAAAAATAAAAARAGSDWRWLPGTGRWRPHVTHIRALRAGAGRGGRCVGSGAVGAGRGRPGGRPLGPRSCRSSVSAEPWRWGSPYPPPTRPAASQPPHASAPWPRLRP